MIKTFTFVPENHLGNNQTSTFASINSKTYQILRGYKLEYREIWLHVAGATALKQSDLGQQWEVRGSKGIYLGYISRYFHYQSTRADLRLTFIGNTTAGSRFLALRFITQRFGLDSSENHLVTLSQIESSCWESYGFGTSFLDEMTSNDPDKRTVYVDFQRLDSADVAKELFEEILKEKGENNEGSN